MLEAVNVLSYWIARLMGFKSRRVLTSQGAIHVLESRFDGPDALPPLLILHGIGAGSAGYLMVMRLLRKRFRRVIVPDLPGHGRSDVPPDGLTPASLEQALFEAFPLLADEPVVLFGNSMGGMVAVRLTTQSPERVLGLLLSSPGGAHQSTEAIQAFLDRFRIGGREAAVDFVGRLYARAPVYAPLIAGSVARVFAQAPLRSLMAGVESRHLIGPAEARALRPPVKLLWGRADRLMLDEHRQFWLENLPAHAVATEPEGFGHCPYLDQPDALADEIVRFAACVSGGRSAR